MRDPVGLQRRAQPLRRGQRRVGGVRRAPVAGVVLVGRQRREGRGVRRVVGRPAGRRAPRVEQVLVGDHRAADAADAQRAGALGDVRDRRVRAREVVAAVAAGGEQGIAGALQVQLAGQRPGAQPGVASGHQVGLEAEGRAQLQQRARARHQLHRGRRDAGRVGAVRRHHGRLTDVVEPPHEGRRRRVARGPGGERPLGVSRGRDRARGRDPGGCRGGDQRRRQEPPGPRRP